MIASINDVDFTGKTILVRVDYNVPIKEGIIQDDTRIQRSLKTINHIMNSGGYPILCSHLGRPKGNIIAELSLKPVAEYLSKVLGKKVQFIDSIDPEVIKKELEGKKSEFDLTLLENTRFNQGEKKNDPSYAKQLAELADLYISDAFGTVHRAHASTQGVTHFLKGYAGFLVLEEFTKISDAMNNPQKPTVAIFGGAKISTKLEVLQNFVDKADVLVLGGGMANTFLAAKGIDVGNSLVEAEMIKTAREIMEKAEKLDTRIILPVDVRIANSLVDPILENESAKIVSTKEIPEGVMILDVGPNTVEMITHEIREANTIIWNGPLGVFENELYRLATMSIAESVIERNVQTVIGGGETVYAINMLGKDIPESIHISTGGGASLELLSGKDLPGIICLLGEVIG